MVSAISRRGSLEAERLSVVYEAESCPTFLTMLVWFGFGFFVVYVNHESQEEDEVASVHAVKGSLEAESGLPF